MARPPQLNRIPEEHDATAALPESEKWNNPVPYGGKINVNSLKAREMNPNHTEEAKDIA